MWESIESYLPFSACVFRLATDGSAWTKLLLHLQFAIAKSFKKPSAPKTANSVTVRQATAEEADETKPHRKLKYKVSITKILEFECIGDCRYKWINCN